MESISLKLSILILSIIFSFSNANARTAIIIVDMQRMYLDGQYSQNLKSPLKELIAKQINLVKFAKKNNLPVIFFETDMGVTEYTIEALGVFKNGRPEEFTGDQRTIAELRELVKGYKAHYVLTKDTNSSLYPQDQSFPEAIGILQIEDIDHIILAGVNGQACVRTTIESGLELGLKVSAFTPGIGDFFYTPALIPYKYDQFPELISNPNMLQIQELNQIKLY